jgi:hypothetical protein
MRKPAGRTLLATPQTDATLKDRYERMGAAAYNAGKPRDPPCDPHSMIGGWWFSGYDAAMKRHPPETPC